MPKSKQFSINYFLEGPYKGAKQRGFSRYFGKYYWARRFYGKLIKRITPQNGKILEIGCGFGDLLSFLENDFQTYGIDVSGDAIKEAGRRLGKTKLAVLSTEEIGRLGENSFDTIIASYTLEHLKNPQKVIRAVFRLLKPKGTFFIVVPNPDSIGRKLKGKKWVGYRDKTHISLYVPDKWFRLLQEEGFTVGKTFGDGLWDSPYVSFFPKIVQQLIFGLPATVQTLFATPFIPGRLGESIVITARKKS